MLKYTSHEKPQLVLGLTSRSKSVQQKENDPKNNLKKKKAINLLTPTHSPLTQNLPLTAILPLPMPLALLARGFFFAQSLEATACRIPVLTIFPISFKSSNTAASNSSQSYEFSDRVV